MADYNVETSAQDEGGRLQPVRKGSTQTYKQKHEDGLAIVASSFLDRADAVIYAIVGICFLIGALIALVYTFWSFGASSLPLLINADASHLSTTDQMDRMATAIIDFISGLLLVLIIMEVLGTVTHYLKSHETSLRPFLFIGIVSAVRSILSVGAKLSIERNSTATGNFTHDMIELGVSAVVVLALGITLKLLGKLVEVDSYDE